ncbi:gluconolaconase, partial [Verminephrobacter sp. Larva24]
MAKPLLEMSAAKVFFDGIFTSPRVAHPEGVAVHRDGSI